VLIALSRPVTLRISTSKVREGGSDETSNDVLMKIQPKEPILVQHTF
jgi:hypothetical protein